MVAADHPYDVVLFGATGFTGGLTADYLAAHGPAELRWALAGRSEERLAAVRDRLAAAHPGRPELAELPLLLADAADPDSLAEVAATTQVVATTVGPYLHHGGPLVAACAAAGTDYVDLTGEPEFVDRAYVEHHATAAGTGARLVHACGFDSIPHDLGAYFTIGELADELGGQIAGPVRMRGVVRSNATFSGGTFHSAITAFSRARQMREAARERRRLEPRPDGRRSRASAAKPGRDPELGLWLLPLPTIDPFVVARSGAALPSYGPDFTYTHFAGTKTLRYAAGGAVGATGLTLAAQVKPVREALLKRVPQGQGPSEKRREKSWFTVDLVAESDGTTVRTRVSGGDPGYTETSKMLAESALSLALDENPVTAGQVTTAAAMGDALIGRLQRAGIAFERR
ncbi:saccharopine dehydrogenase NADP-binding domain-containing protein [Nocardioides sp. zg-536]|uniref:Saccharopine dehydrogenase NADP-binding domain-containing protein n=1 Tax=Nocardioides faecalis TaxID=2803858 RepID=A0A938YAN0_9ACTN|nr:saccharopine dehydrogenase NADP-binding domain-containing protein [Nocardioides faecalis]MBM9460890.1 saccharopine dehydrogenase NADP-binding domain-containing protein [Nocardioides faecalis]MBS4751865.1 saccharopine dehydrogenase NADP-binding domain-containing protein [Nocardioides faecalis]QVI59283.1 saccharopine dehydrogenase NADP-binding domain-containing protein [Nocardioides faecalis]